MATAKDIECESDDGLSIEIAHLSDFVADSRPLEFASLITKQKAIAPTTNVSACATPSLSADSKSPSSRQPMDTNKTPSKCMHSPSQLLQTPDSRLDLFLDVISERRKALREQAELHSPFPSPSPLSPLHSSCYQDSFATPTVLFPPFHSENYCNLQNDILINSTTDIDSTPNHDTFVSQEGSFFSAFPTSEVDTHGLSPASTGSGSGRKTLQDVMSSSSSDFTVVRKSPG